MSSNHTRITIPHGWVEEVLMDLMMYCALNGLDNIAEAIGPALTAANALGLTHQPPAATHEGAPNTTQ
jgi:hypothetical protein